MIHLNSLWTEGWKARQFPLDILSLNYFIYWQIVNDVLAVETVFLESIV